MNSLNMMNSYLENGRWHTYIYTYRVHFDEADVAIHGDPELPLSGMSVDLGYVVGIQGQLRDTLAIDQYTIVQVSRMDFHTGLVARDTWL